MSAPRIAAIQGLVDTDAVAAVQASPLRAARARSMLDEFATDHRRD